MRTDSDLSKLVNQSGFPLQLGIDRLIRDRESEIGWGVVFREHGWANPNGQSGFADLVLEDRWHTSVFVVECKRVLESEWLFLHELPAKKATERVRPWITNTPNHGRELFGYCDLFAAPKSAESTYCVVPGQDKAKPILERVAADVSSATEAIAREERPILAQRGYGVRMYFPVIVTTARLVLTTMDSSAVDLRTGTASSLNHQEVPWVRFRKQLSAGYAVEPRDTDWDIRRLGAAKERVVLIVNVESLVDFLKEWSIDDETLNRLTN